MNRKLLWTIIVAAAVAALAVPKILSSTKGNGTAPAAKSSAQQPGKSGGPGAMRSAGGGPGGGRGGPVAVTAVVVKPRSLSEEIVAPGTILANESVELKSETAGRLVSVSIREGARVAKGALLAKINDADLQAQLQKANASLRLAQDKEARQRGLLEKEVISREDYESVTRDLEAAKADVALLNAQIEKTEVRAPFEGRLGFRYVSAGAYLAPGAKITTIVSDRPLKIEFSAPEKYVSRIRTGDRVTFVTRGGARAYGGSVYAIDPMVDENTRSVRIRALCADPDNAVVPGAFAEVSVIMGEKPSALMVPSPALVPDAAGQKVFCVKAGLAVAVTVATGIRDSVMVEITGGLAPGDTVITAGVQMVRPGAPVAAVVEQ